MKESNQAFGQALVKSLIGERGHIPIARALSDITVDVAGKRTDNMPYSIYQLLMHMSYWQDFMLTYLEGGKPVLPTSVMESWPSEEQPEDAEKWQDTVEHFLQGVEKAVQMAQTTQLDEPINNFPGETKAGILRNIASHNSYHLGEIVLLRRLHGAWPPPGGGYPA
ncbi:DinB family protein [Paenibacillus sp. SYP-B3998]|uniref:DinB family protein n=1 Tax=Paenibacillus sp. SYP-B3998 TaxID=2678564 RepID=A0A6G3ZZ45_9BACL|nr:DinB family protein [Paenibacillus sp. SYP-B3998]NEW07483.1 DinB family protein [Paenibacillus sp. SYP-B3998]